MLGDLFNTPMEQVKNRVHTAREWWGLSAGLVSRWLPRSIVKYMLRHVKPAPEGIVSNVSKERNLKHCLPPSANRPQALTVFLTARRDLRAGKKRGSFWKLTSTFYVEATLQLASRPAGLFSFGRPGMSTRLHKWFVPRMLCDPHAVQLRLQIYHDSHVRGTTKVCAGVHPSVSEVCFQNKHDWEHHRNWNGGDCPPCLFWSRQRNPSHWLRVFPLCRRHKKRALQERKNFEESVVHSVQRRRRSRKAVSSTWSSKRQACKLALEKQRNMQRGTFNHRKGLFQAMEEESHGHALKIKEKLEKWTW